WLQHYEDERYGHYITVGGYAGTGKTHLAAALRISLRDLDRTMCVGFCAFTGKASSVLKERLESTGGLYEDDYVGTIHGMIYRPVIAEDENGRQKIVGWKKRSELPYGMIILDEASMVSSDLWRDLRSYDIPIIAVGDHGQLPPIGDRFSLVHRPDLILNEIHRQALDSAIIRLSVEVRSRGEIPFGTFGGDVYKMRQSSSDFNDLFESLDFSQQTMVTLCGMNWTRVQLNRQIRKKLGYYGQIPCEGERIICLKNNRYTKLMNGQLGTLGSISLRVPPNIYEAVIKMDNMPEPYQTLIRSCCFGKKEYNGYYDEVSPKKVKQILDDTGYPAVDLFDFGYAISVHRSQGSEWDNVLLFEERSQYWDSEFYRRWLYTAVTRAKDKLFIVARD
ncbi:MAG: ATP-binding domain-containing protein, partial [Proteobacteria bacterium]|nr:ATP-binding domain-containing protein [Pseudomonadota bacterium]NIS68941.1 ATP-binding domain-containing protein [Pseudomonadota bacterium]